MKVLFLKKYLVECEYFRNFAAAKRKIHSIQQ